ncbi:MAG: hypothetical protein M0Z37_05055 [Nitrospiraceae bacterium]|nr:hypothetical protein [Nitrospiraceae bacterium]
MSFQLTDHSRRSLWEQFKLVVLPMIFSVLIISALVLSVHFYRMSYAPGVNFSPLTPKSQRSFSFNVSKDHLPDLPGGTLFLKIRKEKGSFGSASYWHSGKTVFSVPLRISSCGICIRLALWDPGIYRITLSDPSGRQVFSSPLRVIAPLALYRDDLVLIFLTVFLSWGSGKLAASVLGEVKPCLTSSLQQKIRLVILAAGLMALGLIFIPYPEMKEHHFPLISSMPAGTVPDKGVVASAPESEGRSEANPLPLSPLEANGSPGYLTIRHHMDSWTEFGRTLTIFEGEVGILGSKNSFFLPPDDGRYFLSLWSIASSGRSLVDTHWALRSIPVSPPIPLALLSGLALFSLSGFLGGVLLGRSVRDKHRRL